MILTIIPELVIEFYYTGGFHQTIFFPIILEVKICTWRFNPSHLEDEQQGKFASDFGVPSIRKFTKFILPVFASAIALMMVWLYFNSVKSGYAAAENFTSSNLSASLPDLDLQQPIPPDARILSEDDFGLTIEFDNPKIRDRHVGIR